MRAWIAFWPCVWPINCGSSTRSYLDWQLSVQKIRHQPHHDSYCHLFALLKAGATQISQPEQYGFEVLPSCRDMTLVALRDQIDEEFWILSSAHYDRYIATGDLFADEPPQEVA